MEEFKDKSGNIIARVIRSNDTSDGVRFYSDLKDILQVGVIQHTTDHIIPIHLHNPVERYTVGTMEVLVVLSGTIQIDLFCDEDNTRTVKKQYRLGVGDAALLYPGSIHGITILDRAKVLEVKSGPYVSKDIDKSYL